MGGRRYDMAQIARKYMNSTEKSLTQVIHEERPEIDRHTAECQAYVTKRNPEFIKTTEELREDAREEYGTETYFKNLHMTTVDAVKIPDRIKANTKMLDYLGMAPPKLTHKKTLKVTLSAKDLARAHELMSPPSEV
jgi:hypothetical protein